MRKSLEAIILGPKPNNICLAHLTWVCMPMHAHACIMCRCSLGLSDMQGTKFWPSLDQYTQYKYNYIYKYFYNVTFQKLTTWSRARRGAQNSKVMWFQTQLMIVLLVLINCGFIYFPWSCPCPFPGYHVMFGFVVLVVLSRTLVFLLGNFCETKMLFVILNLMKFRYQFWFCETLFSSAYKL